LATHSRQSKVAFIPELSGVLGGVRGDRFARSRNGRYYTPLDMTEYILF